MPLEWPADCPILPEARAEIEEHHIRTVEAKSAPRRVEKDRMDRDTLLRTISGAVGGVLADALRRRDAEIAALRQHVEALERGAASAATLERHIERVGALLERVDGRLARLEPDAPPPAPRLRQ